jgi:hypothetical protein
MTDPNLPPVTPPPAYQQPGHQAAPYQQPAYQQTAPAYSQGGAYGQPQSDRYNVLAIVSLVSSFFISLVAVITGHIALNQIKKTGEKGRGIAIAGLVLGYLGILASIVVLLIVIAAIASNPGAFTTTS